VALGEKSACKPHTTGDTVKNQSSEAHMADLIIRDLPAATLKRLHHQANSHDISVEELASEIIRQALRPSAPLEDSDVERVMELVKDLADPEIMARAWQ